MWKLVDAVDTPEETAFVVTKRWRWLVVPRGVTRIIVKVNGKRRTLKTAIFWRTRKRGFLTAAHRGVCQAIENNGLEAIHYAAAISRVNSSVSETQLCEILGGDLLQAVRRVH